MVVGGSMQMAKGAEVRVALGALRRRTKPVRATVWPPSALAVTAITVRALPGLIIIDSVPAHHSTVGM